MTVVAEAPDRGILDCAVHSLNLTIRPGVARLGQAVLDVEISARRLEEVTAKEHLLGSHLLDCKSAVGLGADRRPKRLIYTEVVLLSHKTAGLGSGRGSRMRRPAAQKSADEPLFGADFQSRQLR